MKRYNTLRAMTGRNNLDSASTMRLLGKDRYRQLRHDYDEEAERSEGFDFADKALNYIADKVFKIKAMLPPKGRITYQLLPPEIKKQVDKLVDFMLKQTPQVGVKLTVKCPSKS